MQTFELHDLLTQREQLGERYWEFLRVPSLSMGIYHLKTGQMDPQSPHMEDEVYYVVGGQARFQAGNDVRNIRAGVVLFVERLLEHRFFDITEDLTVLVFFTPAEGTSKRSGA